MNKQYKIIHGRLSKKVKAGFTIVELIVVIVIIGILSAATIVGFTSIQQGARNTNRSADLNTVASALEKYYQQNGEYPSCAAMTAAPTTVTTTTLKGLDPNDLTAPGATAGTNSFTCAAPTTSSSYGYINGGIKYTLEYKEEGSGNIVALNSIHSTTFVNGYTLTVNTGTGGTVSGGGTYNAGTPVTITATPSSYYSFSSWTGSSVCNGLSTNPLTFTLNANTICTANFTPTPITAPAAPTVTANTVSSTTTWSWGAASCGSNTARYQYDYTISPSGYNSGWTATTSTSVAFTTSTTGQTYTVAVQAQCYNAATSSAWSGSGSANYYNPVVYTLTVSAGTGGTVNTNGGVYSAGTQVNIIATPNTYYSFTAWSCGGAQNQLITVNSNITCTASFTPIALSPNPPANPVVSQNTVGSTTTFSWNATTCTNSTASYQYRYTISPSGYDSGWVAYGSTSAAFTTSTEGQIYTILVMTQCSNTATSTSWSGSGTNYYQRYSTWKQITNGRNHTCGIASNNLAYCWGDNTYGQLGNNSNVSSAVPTPVYTSGVLSGKTILSIEAGTYRTCVIASDNNAYCWGDNTYGGLGNNSTTNSNVPVAVYTAGVLSGKTILSISSGVDSSCAMASNNLAYCWGRNNSGQLGNNSTTDSHVPVAVYTAGVLSGKTILSISSNWYSSCAIASGNLAYCWGADGNGQLGNNSTTNSSVPVAVNTSGVLSGKTIKSISANGYFTCAIASDNQAYCWGDNTDGQLGNNSTTESHVPVAVYTAGALSGKTMLSISSGNLHTCAIASDNKAYCWGLDGNGQLGNNSTTNSSVPVAVYTAGVLSGKTISSIQSGNDYFTCAIASDNQAYCWGDNTYGQLGNNSTTNSLIPVWVTPPF